MKETSALKWWGYRHTNGELILKRFLSDDDIKEAQESPFVVETYGPFFAHSREEATARLKEEAAVPS